MSETPQAEFTDGEDFVGAVSARILETLVPLVRDALASGEVVTPEFLSPRQTARLIGVPAKTLEFWRARRTGPPFQKLGDAKSSRILYKRDEVIEWVNSRGVRA